MKIAVTYEDGEIFQHFGHTSQFKVYDTEDGKVISSEIVDTNGQGHITLMRKGIAAAATAAVLGAATDPAKYKMRFLQIL